VDLTIYPVHADPLVLSKGCIVPFRERLTRMSLRPASKYSTMGVTMMCLPSSKITKLRIKVLGYFAM